MPAPPAWGGLDHLVLVTHDMDATVRFYHGVLGMELASTFVMGATRLYSFRIAPGTHVAFFEWSGNATFTKPAGLRVRSPLQFDHVAYNVADLDALRRLQARLRHFDVEVTDLVPHGPMLTSIYFNDPSGISIEVSCWSPDRRDSGTVLLDPQPPAAVSEIEQHGGVLATPPTRLAERPVGIV